MNFVIMISDTFRRDHLGCYGNEWIHTPNLDAFAREATVFDRAHIGSFPTVPHRRDVMTGRWTFTEYDWSPLTQGETVLAGVLTQAGKLTHMILDTPHIMQRGFHYDRGFCGFNWIRGQENDRLCSTPRKMKLECDPKKTRGGKTGSAAQHLRNISSRRAEEDCFCAKTMSTACEWIEANRDEKDFFLYVDTFDPHEPWDAPEYYENLYLKNRDCQLIRYPRYDFTDYLTKKEIQAIRAIYAAECSLVDTWVGKLIATIDRVGLKDNTVVLFTTDHGFYHGEHGLMGKSVIRKTRSAHVPLFTTANWIPFIMRVPGMKPGHISALIQPPDIAPTICDVLKVRKPKSFQGRSLMPLITSKKKKLHDIAVSSQAIIHGEGTRRFSTVTSRKWSLIFCNRTGKEESEAETVDSIRRVESGAAPEMQHGYDWNKPMLFDMIKDPQNKKNVISRNKAAARKLHKAYIEFLQSLGTKEEYIDPLRELRL